MKKVNLLDFLNSTEALYALDCAQSVNGLLDFLNSVSYDEQFIEEIDFGVVFLQQKDYQKYYIVDGLKRILSVSLLLHAVCECYKKTTPRNEKAIATIRKKYLIKGSKFKLKLSGDEDDVYKKIINGERLSGKEKESASFKLLHSFWSNIKEHQLQAANIFKMLDKITITICEADDVNPRDLYYKINENNEVNQILLIEDYLREKGCIKQWQNICDKYFMQNNDMFLFFKDFFVTKFNLKNYNPDKIYINFKNYFETMRKYSEPSHVMEKLEYYVKNYFDIINVNFANDFIKKEFIQIKKHNGEDTYAYVLDVYSDYKEKNIPEETFIDILKTINEYLINRQTNENNVDFNELIQYLNAFIAYK